jgi:hypothetical protein
MTLLFAFGKPNTGSQEVFGMLNCALRFLLPSYSQRWGFVHLWTPKRWTTHFIW